MPYLNALRPSPSPQSYLVLFWLLSSLCSRVLFADWSFHFSLSLSLPSLLSLFWLLICLKLIFSSRFLNLPAHCLSVLRCAFIYCFLSRNTPWFGCCLIQLLLLSCLAFAKFCTILERLQLWPREAVTMPLSNSHCALFLCCWKLHLILIVCSLWLGLICKLSTSLLARANAK